MHQIKLCLGWLRSVVRNTDKVEAKRSTSKPVPETSHRAGVSFHSLPAELQYSIYLYALSNVEIKAVPDTDEIHVPPSTPPQRKALNPMYILSPASCSLVLFYEQVLFPLATTWHCVNWESHVLFTFPTVLSLLDILTSASWPNKRVALVRRLRVFEQRFFQSDTIISEQYEITDVLPVLAWRGLSLDILEYAPILPLRQSMLSTTLLCSPGWRRLHILSIQPWFCAQQVRTMRDKVYRLRRHLFSGVRLVDLPGTPGLSRDRHGEVLGSTRPEWEFTMLDRWRENLSIPDRLGVKEWLDGKDLEVQIIIDKVGLQFERSMPVAIADRANRLNGLCSNPKRWEKGRRTGHVRDCFMFEMCNAAQE